MTEVLSAELDKNFSTSETPTDHSLHSKIKFLEGALKIKWEKKPLNFYKKVNFIPLHQIIEKKITTCV